MNRDDIIRMAQEAGMADSCWQSEISLLLLERFANLIAAAECEALAELVGNCDQRLTPKGIAAAIRARGNNGT